MNFTDGPVAVGLGGVDFEADGVGGGWGDWDGLDLVTVGWVVVYQVEGLQFPGMLVCTGIHLLFWRARMLMDSAWSWG